MQKQDKKSEKTAAPISEEKRQKKMQVRKKLKYGGIATAVTVIFVAVVVLLNVVVAQGCKRNPDAVLDLTTATLYAMTPSTISRIWTRMWRLQSLRRKAHSRATSTIR